MPTNIGTISQGDSTFDARKFSAKMYVDAALANPVFKVLAESGGINRQDYLTQEKGGQVTIYNTNRITGSGALGDGDVYAGSTSLEVGSRTMYLERFTRTLDAFRTGSVTAQRFAGDLEGNLGQSLRDWGMRMVTHAILNQAGGNTATSITAMNEVHTGDARKRIWGGNTATAPTGSAGVAQRAYFANPTSLTTDQGVQGDNTATLQLADFQRVLEGLHTESYGYPNFDFIEGKDYLIVAFVPISGLFQLRADAVTQGAGFSIPQIQYANMAGGKAPISMNDFIWDGIRFVGVPDEYMPKGVHSSTSAVQANVRRCVLIGRGGLDVALGQGQTGGDKAIPGFSIDIDDTRDKNNKKIYYTANAIFGVSKAVANKGDATASDIGCATLSYHKA